MTNSDDNPIKKVVFEARIFDTHEHLIQENDRLGKKIDLFETFFSHYSSSDLVSAGMPREDLQTVRNSSLPLDARWEVLKPFWERVRNTGYARSLDIASRDLYGVNGIEDGTYMELSKRMEDKNKPGVYNWILKEKSLIDLSILDSLSTPLESVDRAFFSPVVALDGFILLRDRLEIESLAKHCLRSIHVFSDLIRCLEFEFERVSKIAVGIKIALAYNRGLDFDKVSEREAEDVFVDLFNRREFRKDPTGLRVVVPDGLALRDTIPLQNYLVHKILQLAGKYGMPVQIHTGIQEGNENIVTNSNPTKLVNLFMEYQEVKFDIFHGSYPYQSELTALAKNFPNVYIDMCWMHIISPSSARQALSDWLDAVPWNKIFGFGGDYLFAEGVYGHSVIARENISKVLIEKVEEGSFTEKQAIHLAHRLLKENAAEFFAGKVETH